MSRRHVNVLIIGGGPAGVAAAITLARLGHRPLLASVPRVKIALEGVSDRTVQACETLGLWRALDTLGPSVVRDAHWSGRRNQTNSEYVIDRQIFDAALLADVGDHDIEILRERVTRTIRSGSVWNVWLSSSGLVTADLLVEARGRSAPLPSEARLEGPETVSLARRWSGVDAAPATRIAAMRNGWAWYASLGGGDAMLQLMVSAGPGTLPKRPALVEFYERSMADCEIAKTWLNGGRASGDVVVRRANPVCARQPLLENIIRVGDAAVAPDPLSGHGVYVALGGGQAAAITLNTMLWRPENAALARSFYEERCLLDFIRLCRIGRDFYAVEQRWPESRFWKARSGWPDTRPSHEPIDSHPPRIERRPVVDRGFITEHEVVVTPDHPRGVWVVDGVPLVPLYRAMLEGSGAQDISQLSARLGQSANSTRTAVQWLKNRFQL